MAVFPSDSIRTKNWGTEILTDSDLEAQLDLLHAYFQAALNSSTGHTHDGTANQGPKLAYGGVATTFGSGFTTVTAASGDYVLIASDVSDSNTTKKALVSDIITASTFTPSTSNALSKSTIQTVITKSSAVASSTGTAVDDDTIPTLTECPVISALDTAITASSASNTLFITATLNVQLGATSTCVASLFLDGASAASSAIRFSNAESTRPFTVTLVFSVAPADTSSHTYKIGIGAVSGTVVTINGESGSRKLGGVLYSSMRIDEIKA